MRARKKSIPSQLCGLLSSYKVRNVELAWTSTDRAALSIFRNRNRRFALMRWKYRKEPFSGFFLRVSSLLLKTKYKLCLVIMNNNKYETNRRDDKKIATERKCQIYVKNKASRSNERQLKIVKNNIKVDRRN